MIFKGKTKYVITAIFLIVVFGVFILNIAMPSREFSENENRYLKQRPEFSFDALVSGNFSADFEEYINDQFIARDGFIAIKSASELISGKKENGGVYFAGDRLIEKFSDVDDKRLSSNIDAVHRFSDSAGVPVTFALIPTAQEIYRDTLTSGAPAIDELALIDKSYEGISSCADIAALLSNHRDEYIFYRSDHHWTSLGAYYGYSAVCDAMNIDASPLHAEPVLLSSNFNGTLYSKSGARFITPDEMYAYIPDEGITVTRYDKDEVTGGLYFTEYLDVKDKYMVYLGGNCPKTVVVTPNEDAPRLLILRDSYADTMTPYLTSHFGEIHLLDLRYHRSGVTNYIEENSIDRVLIVYGTKNFAEDTNISTFLK